MEKQGDDNTLWILGLFYLTIRSRRVAAIGHRSIELTVGTFHKCITLASRPEVAPPAFCEVETAVHG